MVQIARNPNLSRERIVRDALQPGRTINVRAVQTVMPYRALALGRRTFRVPRIRFHDGPDMDALLHRFQKLRIDSQETAPPDDADRTEKLDYLARGEKLSREMAQWCRETAAYCKPYLWPTYGAARWLHKLLRALHLTRLYPNPLRGATEGELVLVLDFLWKCRTNDRATRLRVGPAAPRS